MGDQGQRLAALEARLRRHQRLSYVLLFALAAVALLNTRLLPFFRLSTVQASQFRLVDTDGNVLGAWSVQERDGGSTLLLRDADGHEWFNLTTSRVESNVYTELQLVGRDLDSSESTVVRLRAGGTGTVEVERLRGPESLSGSRLSSHYMELRLGPPGGLEGGSGTHHTLARMSASPGPLFLQVFHPDDSSTLAIGTDPPFVEGWRGYRDAPQDGVRYQLSRAGRGEGRASPPPPRPRNRVETPIGPAPEGSGTGP